MKPTSAHLPTDIDHTIDRALSTLRDVQPRAGLNTRILTSLEHSTTAQATERGGLGRHRTTEPGGLPFRGFIVKGWGVVRRSERENVRRATNLPLWPALTACTIAIASFVILHHHTVSSQQAHSQSAVILSGARSAEPKDAVDARLTANAEPFSTTNRVPQVSILRPAMESPRTPMERIISNQRHPEQSVATRRSPVSENCPDHRSTRCPIHDGITLVSGVTNTADPDAQALADLHAPSHPAPPLPLTPQEKLFLRMLRYGNATQLAELNPQVRAAHDAAETADFQAFFPDPPPLDQPGDHE